MLRAVDSGHTALHCSLNTEEYIVQCAVYRIHCAVCSVPDTFFSVQSAWTLCSVQCSGYTFRCAMRVYTLMCVVCRVYFAVCRVHFAVCSKLSAVCSNTAVYVWASSGSGPQTDSHIRTVPTLPIHTIGFSM